MSNTNLRKKISAFACVMLAIVMCLTFTGCDMIFGKSINLTIKAEYFGKDIVQGEQPDKKDIKVTATYVDNRTQYSNVYQVSSFSCSDVDTSTVGQKTVTITYVEGGITAQCTIIINVVAKPEPVITHITATYAGSDLNVGESLDNTKFEVLAVRDDGSTLAVTDFTVGAIDTSTHGAKIVKITYQTFETSVQVIVLQPQAPAKSALTSLTATYNGGNLQVGESLDASQIVVTAYFSDATQQVITDFTLGEIDTSTEGTKTVTITYTFDEITQATTITVTVEPILTPVLSALNAIYLGNDLQIGESLDKSQFSVTATFSDGSTQTVTDFTLGSVDTTTEGQKTVDISYTFEGVSQSTTVSVTVLPDPQQQITLQSISATYVGNDLQIGGTLDKNQIQVTATFSDGTSYLVSGFEVSAIDTSTAGQKTVTISYTYQTETKQTTVTVNVLEPAVELAKITAVYNGQDIEYNGTLDVTQIVVTAHFSNNTTQVVTDFTTSAIDTSTAGDKIVTITYTHEGITKTATITVTVLPQPQPELVGITAQYVRTKLEVGQTLTNADFIVTASFTIGQNQTVSDFTITPNTFDNVGTFEVEIAYAFNGVTKYATVSVDVTAVMEEVANYGKYGVLSSDGKSVKIIKTAEIESTETLQIHFLELGNKYTGDSVYIKAGDNDILIDAGSRKSSAQTIAKYIDKYCTDGVLEYVIATHAHQDHIAGFVGTTTAKGIFDSYVCETIIDYTTTNSTSQISKDYVTKRNAEVSNGAVRYSALECYNNDNSETRFTQSENATGARRYFKLADNLEMEILYNYYYDHNTSDENDYSVCILINQYGEGYDKNNPSSPANAQHVNSFLFTGDLEKDGEEKLVQYNDLPELVLFKGGHHGSPTSTTAALLAETKPKTICLCTCVGSDEYTTNLQNQFPGMAMMQRVAAYTDMLFATSLFDESLSNEFTSFNGDITVTSNHLGVNFTASNHLTLIKDSAWFKNRYTEWSTAIALKQGAV